jgi:DNA-binding MarR family transcriptional regulator
MHKGPQISERTLAELLAHLGRITYGEGFMAGLTPAQRTALRYFSRANRFSRTVSAFAEFHATTRGTASQTIKSLVSQGYITRTRSKVDGRSARLDLTDKASAILMDDPFEALVRAARALSVGTRGQLARGLGRMLDHVARERGKHPFGTCSSCAHLEGDDRGQEENPPHRCGFVGAPLNEAELDQLCINFAPGNASAMRHRDGGAAPR